MILYYKSRALALPKSLRTILNANERWPYFHDKRLWLNKWDFIWQSDREDGYKSTSNRKASEEEIMLFRKYTKLDRI